MGKPSIRGRGPSFVERNFPRLLVLPVMIYLAVFIFLPFGIVIYLSLGEMPFGTSLASLRFAGATNYIQMFFDEIFHIALLNTAIFVSVAVTIELLLGLGLALLLNMELKARGLWRTLLLIPMITTPIVIGNAWRLLYNSEYGALNAILMSLGLIEHPIAFLGNAATALPSLILVDIWQWTPFMMLIILAGLQALPTAPYEAALIDGASRLTIFRKITIPMLMPAIVVAVLLRFMDAFARTFDIFYITTFGGPGTATEVVGLYIYKVAFRELDLGYAAALTVVMLFLVIGLCNILLSAIEKARGG